jgi:signal transduction histidine kinase
METRLEAFIERSEQDLELTQLGLAVEIINHEFQTSIRAIRENLRRLKTWADTNTELRGLYRDLRGAFDHLDGYLRLFTPLHRRLYRKPVDIRGRDVERFVRDVFRERLSQAEIELSATDAFREHTVHLYPSTLYPVFVNLVANAVHWLTGYRGQRRIGLDLEADAMTLTDTGPGISERDREAVFEMGFTRKPGGTGYGLYIAREVLRREGMDLVLDPANPDRGARFRICTRAAENSDS